MTTRPQFTADEWKTLTEAPVYVGSAVAAAAPSGLIGTIKEGISVVNSMLNTAKQYPDNTLIQEVAPKGVGREQIESWANMARGLMQQSEAERLKTMGVEACRKVTAVLQTKGTPQESEGYKRWLLQIGQGVASAAKEESQVPNTGGGAVSLQEAQLLREMASMLGVPSAPAV
ncbi:MAG: hypothetical protein IMW89_21050 [Ktedonobacteraceae bacterium]|nr:hypothetical protein [Ktedonobacteraceae bacterium]